MRYLRVLHNGDLRKETALPSPHWMVHVREDGSVWGEVLMRDWGRMLPTDFRIPDHERFFDVPAELSRHQLAASPHPEEIIVSLEPQCVCSFLMSQLPTDCRMRSALSDLLARIREVVEAGANSCA